jgi:Tetratricopeptide repeat
MPYCGVPSTRWRIRSSACPTFSRASRISPRSTSIAKQLDPAHFSHPQLMLSEIHLQRNEQAAAIEELEDFLRRHPDAPEAAGVKAAITRLRQ